MKKICILILTLFVACVKQPEMDANQLTITAVSTDFNTLPNNKVTETAFEAGDKIGVFLGSDNGKNLRYETSDGNSWTGYGNIGAFENGRQYYATAYCPYADGATDLTHIEHSVKSDQNNDFQMEKSDFLVCKATKINVTNNLSSAKLNFVHILSKLQVVINVPSQVAGFDIASLDSVVVRNAYNNCAVDLTAPAGREVGSLTNAGNVYGRLTNDCDSATMVSIWEAVIIPQTISRVDFVFKTVDGTFVRQSYTQNLALTSGVKTTLNATSNADLYFASTLDLKYGDAQTDLPLSIFVAKGRTWTITCDAPWVKIAPSSGTGTGAVVDVKVSVTANSAAPYAIRTAKITLSDNKPTSVSYTVMQNYSKFDPSTTTLTFNSASQQYQAIGAFASNRVYAVSITNSTGAGWAKLATSATIGQGVLSAPYEVVGSLGKDKLFVQIGASNETAAARTEKVQFKIGTQVIKEFSVTQMPIPATVTVAGVEWTVANLSGQAGQAISAGVALDPSAYGNFFKWGDKWVYERVSSSTDGDWTTKTSGASTAPATSLTSGYGYDFSFGLSGGRASGDPCKMLGAKYATPTRAQFAALVASGKSTWTKYKNINGYVFGAGAASYVANAAIPNGCVFLPASGFRLYSDGSSKHTTTNGYYWTASVCDANFGHNLGFNSIDAYSSNQFERGNNYAVRCVVAPPTPPATVAIAGTEWCTTNLTAATGQAATATLAPYPQDGGVFYKWGDTWAYARASSATDGTWTTATSGASTAPATSQTIGLGYDYGYGLSGGRASGDPCALLGSDYRTPTRAQWQTLTALGSKWATHYGVNGRFVGAAANSCNNTTIAAGCVFLPAAGLRNNIDGALLAQSAQGYYWASTVYSNTNGWHLYFINNEVKADASDWRGRAFPVRCVKVGVPPPPTVTTVTIGNDEWVTANLDGVPDQSHDAQVTANPSIAGKLFKWGSTYVYDRINGAIPADHWGGSTTMASTAPATSTTNGGYDYGVGLSGSTYSGDPCLKLGEKYRTPTNKQWTALAATTNKLGTYKDVNGYFFGASAASCNNTTIATGCIFFPFATARGSNGSYNAVGPYTYGCYWASSVANATLGSECHISNDGIFPNNSHGRGTASSVRCVKQ